MRSRPLFFTSVPSLTLLVSVASAVVFWALVDRASAQEPPLYNTDCYPGGNCVSCAQTFNTYYCVKIFQNMEPGGNCGGGQGKCDYDVTCELMYSYDTNLDIGACNYVWGCEQVQ